jgi:protein-S-isoprenylcysteine O-methyltransferase Ste14
MPLEIGKSVNGLSNYVLKAPGVFKIMKNPIYTAMFIILIIMIIIIIIFKDETFEDNSLLVLTVRTGFWSFLFLISVFFIHNKILISEKSEVAANDKYDEVFNGGTYGKFNGGAFEDNIIPVRINADFTQ